MNDTVTKLRSAMEQSPYDWLALGSAPHVTYATGYRSVAGDLFRSHRMLALVSADRAGFPPRPAQTKGAQARARGAGRWTYSWFD